MYDWGPARVLSSDEETGDSRHMDDMDLMHGSVESSFQIFGLCGTPSADSEVVRA